MSRPTSPFEVRDLPGGDNLGKCTPPRWIALGALGRMRDMDDPSDWQRRIEAIRGHLIGAAAGFGVAAVIIMLAPVSLTTALGLHNPALAAKLGLLAGAVWAVLGFV